MKKIILLIISLISTESFSQAITVNTNTYTVPQLVSDVLVNKSCVPVSNITSSTGTNFGSTNGIGYFENSNPSFPLSSGVILSTGNVTNAPGPNTTQLDDGSASWAGDSDLEATLKAAGIEMKSTNATVLEFDFVPFSSNFDFQFLFASEEYGNFQCQFSDAFAFLLTNKSTGVTTNLAVVPNSTTPISVVTIRNSLYNSSCSSENSAYFGEFNGGSNAAGSEINFNGQTIAMSAASSTLTPNTPYHIKLVIADRKDFKYDSAIFLGANSFNVGQDVLGSDLTVANNTAICNASTHTLTSGLDPAIYSFAWTLDGNPIGGNTPNLPINKAGVYGLTYTIIKTDCPVNTDFIKVEYFSPIQTPNPKNLFQCESGQDNFTFNLLFNTPIVQVPGTQVSYHLTQAQATSGDNSLPNNYTIARANLPVTIWARIEDTTTKCAIEKSFQLELIPSPVVNNPGDMIQCETIVETNTANFNIGSQTASILGGQSPTIYNVSYYTKIGDANEGSNPINTSFAFPSKNATIFVRVQNSTDTTCFITFSFNLIVKALPDLDFIKDQYVCSGYTLPVLINPGNYYSGPNKTGIKFNIGDVITTDQTIYIYQETGGTPSCSSEKSFKVTFVKPGDVKLEDEKACDQYILPALANGTRYFTMPGGPTGGGTELIGDRSIINTLGTTKVYTYFVSTDKNNECDFESDFDVTIIASPKITDLFPNVFACTSYDLPPLAVGDYYTRDTSGNYFPAHSPITTTTTLYVFATNNSCRTQDKIFTVYIGTLGLININQCQPYNLPPAPVGEYRDAPNGGGKIISPGLIEKTTTVYFYVPGAGIPNCTDDDFFTITIYSPFITTPIDKNECESFPLPIQPEDGTYYSGPNKGLPILNAGDIISTTTTLYIYKPSTTVVGCYTEKPWQISINKKPIIDSRSDIVQCNSYVLSPITNGGYYDDPNGVNPLTPGTVISKNNRIYIFAANAPNCFTENFFDITINGVEADPIPTQLSYCDSFTFPPLPTPNNFYYDAPGGPSGGGNIIPFGTTVNLTNLLPTYYIYYETGDRFNCNDENAFSITISISPFAYPVNSLETCDTFGTNDGIFQFDLTTLSIRNQVLNGQIPDTNYTLTFFTSLADANDSKAIPIANPSTYQNDNPYSDSVWVRVTNNLLTTPCYAIVELKLIINPLPNPKFNPEYFICEDYQTGTLLNPATIDTGISGANYVFEWTLEGIPFGGNTPSITTSQIGNYAVEITNTTTNCVNTASTKVSKYAPYLEITYSDAFETPTFISANVMGVGSGNYEYKLDDFVFQDSNVFNNVLPGEHIISVRDKNGHCNPIPLKAVIMNYSKFFTPNGDGFNETWNIPHLLITNPNAPISIFDLYGRFLKQITPSGEGWNGEHNGQPLPSTDYWFTVDYIEKGVPKIFRSHFSLKR